MSKQRLFLPAYIFGLTVLVMDLPSVILVCMGLIHPLVVLGMVLGGVAIKSGAVVQAKRDRQRVLASY